jgi:AAA15 family ATPase/GTPase
MLLQFKVKNYLSIKEESTLSMVASKDSSHENNTIIYNENTSKSKKALKTAVIYGANASGKTNILKAFNFVSRFINISHQMQQGSKINRIPFKLNRACKDEPSEFQVIFKHLGTKYLYGFAVTEEEVVNEYLYYYPNKRQSIIFERDNVDEYKFTIDSAIQTELKNKFHSKNKLFLSTESLWEYEKAKIPFEWLSNFLNIVINHDVLKKYTADLMYNNEIIEQRIKRIIRIANLGINDITIEKSNKPLLTDLFNIKTSHLCIGQDGNNIDVQFNLDEESEGTKKFFGLLGPWIDVLSNGSTLIVDDLNIRLHTKLTRVLIDMFNDPKINTKNAQLIFSTHDTNLLDQDIFRRDQIWFTEKKEDHSTDLYSLQDFGGVRKDKSIEKGYLQGKYGAIPMFAGDWSWD